LGIICFVLLGGRPAPAYWIAMENGIPIAWTANSPPSIWNNATHTLSWSFDPIGFPQANWPTVPQAGAAFQNAFQSLQDVSGAGLKFIRLPNSTGAPQSGDGRLQACLTPNATTDYFGQNIATEVAVTYITFDTASGTLLDGDIEVNGDPSGSFPKWATTGPSAPSGFLDLESTALSQAMAAMGASTTPFFSAAAWPLLRAPGDALHDRCLSPDDRMYARTIAPAAPAFSTLSGTVTVQGSGTACNLAIVVATDADGVPQATTVTHPDGTYSLNIPSATSDTPPLTSYTVTAHHFLNGTYKSPVLTTSPDLSFSGGTATGFIAVQPPAPVDTRGGLSSINFTVTAGNPSLTLLQQSISPAPLATQVLFLDPNGSSSSGTLQFSFQRPGSFTSLSNLSLGPGITLGAPTVTPTGPSQALVSVTYSLATPTPPGLRNLSFSIPGGEQFFLPAVVEVQGQGGLSVLAGPQNPSGQNPANSQTEVPLLQVTLTAAAGEDVRLHQLSFSLSGQGATPAAVHLWNDAGSAPGVYDGGDIPIFTGNAYFQNPAGETVVPSGANATLTYDNLSLTIPAGTSITLLLTADMPSFGTGSYTATLDPTVPGTIIAQGMSWGDALAPSGSAVSGGLVTLGSVSIGTLGQFHTADNSVIPVGGFTTETQVTIQGTVSSPSGMVGMEAEAKPIGVAFDGTGTQIQAATAASGSVITVVLTGLSTGTGYHWRARGLSSTGLASIWVSFGNNSESAMDFAVDQSTVSLATALTQRASLTGATVPPGGSAESGIILLAQAGTDSLGYLVRVEFEVEPSGSPFTNLPTSVGPFGAGGFQTPIVINGTSGTFHWQARTVTMFGVSSAWSPMSGTTDDFSLTAPPVSSTKGGCIASVDAGGPRTEGVGWICLAGGISFLLFLPRRWKRAGGLLGALLLTGALAYADTDPPLPRSLLETPAEDFRSLSPGGQPADSAELLAQDAPAPVNGPFSFDAYAGALFVDTKFSAVGTDHVVHQIQGTGQALFGVEGLYSLNDDWRIGIGAQGSFWQEVQILSVGPVVTWRFAHAKDTTTSGRFKWDHVLRAQIAYETFTDTKSGFGSFNGTVGASVGYEFRLNLTHHYSLTLGADLQYAQWTYSPRVLSGDTSVGGLGGFFYVGVAVLP
ncbi:MAG TPA: hypothetical protein VKU80_08315, partial [Planctomycetota bacterium]|nr:hypothetical protein [Planctomycetota bacterium]